MMLYYPLEHVSYIGFMAPKLIQIDAGKISRQSCIAWLMYIILDMYANQRRIRKLALEECSILEGSDDTDRKKKLPEIRTRKSELHYTQLRNACLLPTCLHWSIHEGVLPESVVQYLCCLEACVGLWRAWTNSTRQSERAQRS
ncbi:unnamed protein product [Albugo candida]|nr:unnamed protein product [Albugo candida]|eukprot:CCI41332.1 unnamed protein product [Albugo candida]